MMERAGADITHDIEFLCSLIYELLDAHADTLQLSANGGLRWEAHLEYLRALQRKAREILAYTSATPDRR